MYDEDDGDDDDDDEHFFSSIYDVEQKTPLLLFFQIRAILALFDKLCTIIIIIIRNKSV